MIPSALYNNCRTIRYQVTQESGACLEEFKTRTEAKTFATQTVGSSGASLYIVEVARRSVGKITSGKSKKK